MSSAPGKAILPVRSLSSEEIRERARQAERDYPHRVDPTHLYQKPFNDPRILREFSFVLELFAERIPGGTILDLGCGSGWTSLMLARAGFKAIGVDISERMLEIAQDRNQQENVAAEFVVGDMETLDLTRNGFDGVLFFDCLHHCPGYAQALCRAYDHLTPGGYLVAMETTPLHRISPHARSFSREFGVTELGFSRHQLRTALQEAGFCDITFYYDPGHCYRGFTGFLQAWLRLVCSYFLYYPQAKNIVVARKP